MARQLGPQFHATLNPSWAWGADGPNHSAEVSITDPTTPDSIVNGRISWDGPGSGATYFPDSGDIYDIEGEFKTLGDAVTAFNKQHIPSARVVKKFKNSEVQPLAQQIQDAGGYDGWKSMVNASSAMLGGKVK